MKKLFLTTAFVLFGICVSAQETTTQKPEETNSQPQSQPQSETPVTENSNVQPVIDSANTAEITKSMDANSNVNEPINAETKTKQKKEKRKRK